MNATPPNPPNTQAGRTQAGHTQTATTRTHAGEHPHTQVVDEPVEIAGDAGSEPARDRSFLSGARLALIVLGAGALVAGALALMRSGGEPLPPASQIDAGVGSGQKLTRETATPAYQNAVRTANAEGADRARNEGKAFIPDVEPAAVAPATAPRSDALNAGQFGAVPQAPLAAPGPGGGAGGGNTLAYATPVAPTQPYATPTSTEERVNTQDIEKVIRAWSPGGESIGETISGTTRKTSAAASTAAPTPAAADPTAARGSGGLPQSEPPGMATARGKAFMAVLEKRVETTLSDRVIATVLHGPFEGAQVRGKAVRAYESMRIEFDQILLGGKLYQIAAMAVDEQMANDLLEGKVDRRVLQRYVLPIMLSGAEKAAQIVSQPASTTTIGAGGAVAVSQPQATDRQIIGGVVSGGLGAVKDIYTQDVPPKTVTLEPQTNIGVFFF